MTAIHDETKIELPLTTAIVNTLHSGMFISLQGALITARDAAHARLQDSHKWGHPLPIVLFDTVIYYVGPSPTPPGHIIGSAGPTTAVRMEPYLEFMLQSGVRGIIGKGALSDTAAELLKKYNAVYFLATGGAAALYAQTITAVEIIAYHDLGAEAIRKITVKSFPCIVAMDAHGGNIFKEGQAAFRQ